MCHGGSSFFFAGMHIHLLFFCRRRPEYNSAAGQHSTLSLSSSLPAIQERARRRQHARLSPGSSPFRSQQQMRRQQQLQEEQQKQLNLHPMPATRVSEQASQQQQQQQQVSLHIPAADSQAEVRVLPATSLVPPATLHPSASAPFLTFPALPPAAATPGQAYAGAVVAARRTKRKAPAPASRVLQPVAAKPPLQLLENDRWERAAGGPVVSRATRDAAESSNAAGAVRPRPKVQRVEPLSQRPAQDVPQQQQPVLQPLSPDSLKAATDAGSISTPLSNSVAATPAVAGAASAAAVQSAVAVTMTTTAAAAEPPLVTGIVQYHPPPSSLQLPPSTEPAKIVSLAGAAAVSGAAEDESFLSTFHEQVQSLRRLKGITAFHVVLGE